MKAKADLFAGNLCYSTLVEASANGNTCDHYISSDCGAIQRMTDELTAVDPFEEISTRRGLLKIPEMGAVFCTHTSCPVPVGIVKAVEISAGLALLTDVSIRLSKGETR